MSGPFRLLCALLTLLLAVPAVQAGGSVPDVGAGTAHHARHAGGAQAIGAQDHAPHKAIAQNAAAHDGHGAHHGNATHDGTGMLGMNHPACPEPSQPAIHHDCIGCVAPIDIGVYRPVEQLDLAAGDKGWTLRPTALTDWAGTPETPPPQISI